MFLGPFFSFSDDAEQPQPMCENARTCHTTTLHGPGIGIKAGKSGVIPRMPICVPTPFTQPKADMPIASRNVGYCPYRTWASALPMSAFGCKTDMPVCIANVAF
jgi:hypothetical protein